MKKNMIKILSLIFISLNLNALDLNEAIEIGLNNNNFYKKKQYEKDEAKQTIIINQGNFLPALDLEYNYYNNKVDLGQGKTNANAKAIISYSLFEGFKDKYNLKASKNSAIASNYSLLASKYDLIYNIKLRYITYLKSIKNIETFKNAYELLQKQYEDSQNKFEQGLVAKNDLLQVNAQMLQAKQNLITQKANSKIAWYNLKNILGGVLKEDNNIEDLEKQFIDLFDYDEQLLYQRSEIKAIKENIEALINQKKSNIYGSSLPKISLDLSYTKFGEDASLNSNNLEEDEQSTASVNLKWNLYNGGKDKAQTVILQKKVLQAKEDLQSLKLDIKLQYEKALEDFEVSKLNYETAKISLEQSKENYKIVNNRFKEGISSSTDLINANFLLSQAKQSFNNAYYDKFLAKASLDRIFEK